MTDKLPDLRLDTNAGKVVEDKRKTISPYNSVKNLKYAKLPAKCNDCIYRSIEAGGNGKCSQYEVDAACGVRKDIKKFLNKLDTRNADDLAALLDFLTKQTMENVMIAFAQSKMDGNIPDRNTRSEVNNLLNIIKILKELSSVEVSETREFDKAGDIKGIFRTLKSGGGGFND